MREHTARRLRARGWKVGTASEFLGLTEQESEIVEIRLALSRSVRARRAQQGLSQTDLASRLGSSQSRVAKLESADPTVSLDLLIRGLVALGASRRDIARAVAEPIRGVAGSAARSTATLDSTARPSVGPKRAGSPS